MSFLIPLTLYGQPDADEFSTLKNTAQTDWVLKNPELPAEKPSFFRKKNYRNYYVAPVEMTIQSLCFCWDDTYSFPELSFLKKGTFTTSNDADSLYGASTISWPDSVHGIAFYNGRKLRLDLMSWNLANYNECYGTINFPYVLFGTAPEVPMTRPDSLNGILLLPDPGNVSFNVTSSERTTLEGVKITGKDFDLNADGIADVFVYSEFINEFDRYIRLYLNVSGNWICTWVHFDELCP